jgi:hypothetical protein
MWKSRRLYTVTCSWLSLLLLNAARYAISSSHKICTSLCTLDPTPAVWHNICTISKQCAIQTTDQAFSLRFWRPKPLLKIILVTKSLLRVVANKVIYFYNIIFLIGMTMKNSLLNSHRCYIIVIILLYGIFMTIILGLYWCDWLPVGRLVRWMILPWC